MVVLKSVDHWQRVQSDNEARFIIQGTERREGARIAFFRLKPASKRITGGH
jgi:TolB-like protein